MRFFLFLAISVGFAMATAEVSSPEDDREAISAFAQGTDLAFFTVVQSDNFVDGALVMACSFFAHNNNGPLIALVANVSDDGILRLRDGGMYVARVDPLGSRQLARRHETFTKLSIWTFTEFKEGVFIDADVVILNRIPNFDSSPEREAQIVATGTSPKTFNSGFFWFRPSKQIYDDFIKILRSNDTSWHQGQTINLTEQDLLIHYFVGKNLWAPMAGCIHVTLAHLTAGPTSCLAVLHFVGYPKPFDVDFSNEAEWRWERSGGRADEWKLLDVMGRKRWAFDLWRTWSKNCNLPPFLLGGNTTENIADPSSETVFSGPNSDSAEFDSSKKYASVNETSTGIPRAAMEKVDPASTSDHAPTSEPAPVEDLKTLRDYSQNDITFIKPTFHECIHVPPGSTYLVLFKTSQVVMPTLTRGALLFYVNGEPLEYDTETDWVPNRKAVDVENFVTGYNNMTITLLDFTHTSETIEFWVTRDQKCEMTEPWRHESPPNVVAETVGGGTVSEIMTNLFTEFGPTLIRQMQKRKPDWENQTGAVIAMTTCNTLEVTQLALLSILLSEDKFSFIIIDESSTDGSVAWLREWGVEVFAKENATGLTASWNTAWENFVGSKYDVLMLANNDILIPDGSVGNLTECAVAEGVVAGPLATQIGVGASATLMIQSVEGTYSLDFHQALNSTDPINFQTVQNSLGHSDEVPRVINNEYLNGFFLALPRAAIPVAFSPTQFFDPKNVVFGQETELQRKLENRDDIRSASCTRSFVYHFKGLTVHNQNLPDKRHWANDPKAYTNLRPNFNPRQYSKLVQIGDTLAAALREKLGKISREKEL